MTRDLANRHQNQPWYIKLWRHHYYIPIPYKAIKIWFYERKRPLSDPDDWRMSFNQCWRLATEIQQYLMEWYFTQEEVFKNLKEEYDENEDYSEWD